MIWEGGDPWCSLRCMGLQPCRTSTTSASTTTTDLDVPGSIPPRLLTRHLVKVKVKLGLGSGLETGLGKGRVRVGVSWVCFARHRQQRTSVVREVCNLI